MDYRTRFLGLKMARLWLVLAWGFRVCVVWALFSPLMGAEGDWSVRVWQSDEGLPDNVVTGVAQTSDGFLWVATPSGLVRFDGVRFQAFAPANTSGVQTISMQQMIVDHRGRLWVAKEGGVLLCVNAGRTKAFTDKDGLPKLTVLDMDEDGAGAIWVSYWNGPVIRILDGRVSVIRHVSTEIGSGYRIASDVRGEMWINHAGLSVFRDGKFLPQSEVPVKPTRLGKARSGGIWICDGSQLYKYSEGSGLVKIGTLPRSGDDFLNVTALYEDHTGSLWIGTSSGLFRYDASGFTSIKTSNTSILCITEDREGNIWVGTRGGGLNRVRPAVLSLEGVGTDPGYLERGMRSVCQDTDGSIWAVANNDEVVRREANVWIRQSASNDAWPHEHCLSVAADPQGGVWIGTAENHLFLWRGRIVADYSKTNGLVGRTARTLLTTSSGDVWIGSRAPDTLQRLHAGHLQTFGLPADSGYVAAMVMDASGIIWAGTSAGLLFRVSGDQLINETQNKLTASAAIHCLSTSPDGRLWIGYAGEGMGMIRAGRFYQFKVLQGLATDNILQIVPDGRGRIWFAGTSFIFFIREKEFDALIEGRISQLKSVVSGKNAGLPVLQASQGCWPDSIRSRDGRLGFATMQGLLIVDVDKIKEHLEPPPVVIERVNVDGHTAAAYQSAELLAGPDSPTSIELGQNDVLLRLPPSHRRVEIEFTALSLSAPENVACKYRLQGVDNDWVNVSGPRTAYYGHIPPGDYRFQVIACNNAGVWNPIGASLTLTSEPHIWETTWFQVTAGASVIGLAVVVMQLTLRRRHKQQVEHLKNQHAVERERTRIAQDLHDDLGTTLTQIDILGARASRPGIPVIEAMKQLGVIRTKSKEMITALDEIVWAVNPRNDSLASLVEYLCGFAEDFLAKASIHCRLDMPEDLPDVALQADLRHNLFLTFKETLNNVVRHSGATEVWLRLKWVDRSVTFVVQDDGVGFDPALSAATDRNGLRNMMERMNRIGGKYELHSQPKLGTSVKFTFSLP